MEESDNSSSGKIGPEWFGVIAAHHLILLALLREARKSAPHIDERIMGQLDEFLGKKQQMMDLVKSLQIIEGEPGKPDFKEKAVAARKWLSRMLRLEEG